MSRNGKKNRIQSVEPKSSTHIAPPGSTDDQHPTWCFRYLQRSWSVDDLTRDQKSIVLNALAKRSETNWRELKKASSKGLGREFLEQYRIKATIPAVLGSSKVEIFQQGDMRLAGIKRDAAFLVVWIDFNYALYDH